jgi:hypothetical protein
MRAVDWPYALVGLAVVMSVTGWSCPGCFGGGTYYPGDDDTGLDDDDDDDPADDDTAGPVEECPTDVQAAVDDLQDWSERISCAAVHFGAAPDEQQTTAIDLVLQLQGTTLKTSELYQLSLDGVAAALHLQTGENLLHYDCNDALWLEEIVHRSWTATGGMATLQIRQVHEWGAADADLTLAGVVVLEDAAPFSRCELPEVTFEELSVGWYPG